MLGVVVGEDSLLWRVSSHLLLPRWKKSREISSKGADVLILVIGALVTALGFFCLTRLQRYFTKFAMS